jgi:citrate/tricarballylate utilization protein
MPTLDELTREGAHVMTVCNACRYCEQYCPVFPAMEQRLTFGKADLNYLANLCHNCGECLYACQYAPPHEFGINVPRTLASIRLQSFEEYAWPRPLAALFRQQNLLTGTTLALALIAAMLAASLAVNGSALFAAGNAADFYAVMPHGVMIAIFGGVGVYVLAALAIGVVRCRRDLRHAVVASGFSHVPLASGGSHTSVASGFSRKKTVTSAFTRASAAFGFSRKATRDILTLRHLHATGEDCVNAEEARAPWRRWFHHATFYGFMLCFASTSVAALYHTIGWEAPYAYISVPVLLGTFGGLGLLAGPAGLLVLKRRRDPALTDPAGNGLDLSFLVLLLLTSVTGLLLLALRHQPMMGVLLIVHLGIVLALFLTLPYGKFVHGFYRTVALVKYAREDDRA